jgi:multimeric flavodoxin WrbA
MSQSKEKELEQFTLVMEGRDKIAEARKKKGLEAVTKKPEKKKIIGLSCGTKNGNCETFIKEAAKGAEEFGIETEIIRAIELKVNPCKGCGADLEILRRGKLDVCPIKDDVPWILEKTVLEDAALIVAAPVYYIRSNALFMSICERMHPTMFSHLEILKKRKVGAIISVGGGVNGWTAFGLSMVNIWVQHFATLVDQMQVEMRLPGIDWFARARELGRNVARAMLMPIEEVKYVGPEPAVSCPVCHCDILQVPQDLPNVYCPVCWVRGVISVENGKMKVKWNEWDINHARFSEYGVWYHLDVEILKYMADPLAREHFKKLEERKKEYKSFCKIIKPPVKS